MSAFKIKSNLDIGGNQLLNYCVGTYNDLTSVNRNTGYKLFYVPVDLENKWYRRELIFDGEDWHAAAYLDDIEALTNGEGSLGTRVKALEDMLGLEDVTDVIDTWNDVKAFFANVDEGLDLMTMLNGKAEWNQDISSDSFKAIGYGYVGTGWRFNGSALSFGANSTYYAQLQISDIDDHIVFRRHATEGFSDWKEILHEGNFESLIGDTYLKTDGSNRLEKGANLKWVGISENGEDYNSFGYGFRLLSYDTASDNYRGGIHVGTYYGFQLTRHVTSQSTSLTVRFGNPTDANSWSDWKTIAFTDSDITGNAATATKLKDKVSLWGNEFDGTQSLSGGIKIRNESGVYFKNSANTKDILSAHIDKSDRLFFGMGALANDMPTYLLGKTLGFQVGSSYITAMTITEEGAVNVGEGGLKVAGGIKSGDKFILTATSMNLGSATTPLYLFLARPDANYIWASANGGYINLGVYDSGTTNSANATLSIYSDRVVSGQRNNAVSLGTSSFRWSDVYSVGGNFSGRVLIGGAEDDGESALQVNNKMSIGASKTSFGLRFDRASFIAWIPDDYQFSHNMPFQLKKGDAVLGEFGHYIANGKYIAYIGNNFGSPWFSINSTESFFNVATTFNGGALIPTGQKLTIGDANGDHATIEYDSIAKAIKVDGNLFTTGTNASGGKADAQQGGTGGNAEVHRHDLDWGKQVYEIQNVKGDVNVNVQVYEWNASGNSWDMILTDVSVTENNILVTFGRPTTVPHMVTVV